MARGKPIKQDSPESSALSDLSDVDVKAKKGRNGDKAQAKRKVATKSTPADPPSKRARTTKAKAEPKPDPLEDDTEEELDKPAAKQGKAASSSDSKPKRLSKKDKEDEQFSVESIAKHPPRSGPAGAKHKIGAHTSTSGGPEFALLKASELGANALAMFLKNQRRWESKDLEQENITRFRKMMLEKDAGGLDYGSDYILPHGSYLINLGNPDDSKREVSYKCFLDDLQRCEQLGIKLYNWHPGSTVGACTKSEALKNVAESINRAHGETKNVICVIENMAGTGNILGATWEELAEIIDGVKDKSRVGVCIDTCHAFAAGYDIRTKEKYEETIQKFDDVVGLQYLKGMHINDSKGGGLGCHKDRHENIGLGEIGLAAFRFVVRDERLAGIPLILETPTFEETEVWQREIKLLYELQEVDGTDAQVEARLKQMTEDWRKELAEMRRKSGKDQPKAPKAKKGKKADQDENSDDDE